MSKYRKEYIVYLRWHGSDRGEPLLLVRWETMGEFTVCLQNIWRMPTELSAEQKEKLIFIDNSINISLKMVGLAI